MELFKGKSEPGSKSDVKGLLKNKKMLAALGGLGVLLLFNPFAWLTSGSSGSPSDPKASSGVSDHTVVNTDATAMNEYEQAYEKRLTAILDDIRGVSDASVMVTIDSSEETVYATDTTDNEQTVKEDDNKGGNRTTTQFDKQDKLVTVKKNGTDEPVVIKTVKPKVRGVVVVAKGAENIKIQALITEAVQRVLDVPPHHISILPKNE